MKFELKTLPHYGKIVNILIIAIILRVYYYGWVTDDAFITFRSVLNFINGDGLVFNLGERVQSYTHPLWFLMLSFFAYFDTNLYFLSIVIGVVLTAFTLIYLKIFYKRNGSKDISLAFILVLFLNSDIFLQFSTSGLENSLTNLLLIMIFYYFTVNFDAIKNGKQFNIFFISVLVALLLTNRFDQIFLIAPLYIYLLFKNYKYAILGLSPLFIWHIFSLVYYGFLFPNTKYAKIGARTLSENIKAGFNYFIDSFQSDILFFLLMFVVLIFGFTNILKNRIQLKKDFFIFIMVIGILFQIFYVIVLAGGDFMRGRFFISILLMTALLFSFLDLKIKSTYLPFFLVCSFLSYYIGFNEKFIIKTHGIENERNYYKKYLALNLEPYHNYTLHPWGINGQNFNKNDKTVPIIGVNGQRGYWIDKTKLIDLVGLTDAFIARTPVINSNRTGHFEHNIPQEYFRLLSGEQINFWKNKDDEELYKNLTIVISGEIVSKQRIKSMIYLWQRYGI